MSFAGTHKRLCSPLSGRGLEILRLSEATGFRVEQWYQVRVVNDAIVGDVMPPSGAALDQILEAEDRAGYPVRRTPYLAPDLQTL